MASHEGASKADFDVARLLSIITAQAEAVGDNAGLRDVMTMVAGYAQELVGADAAAVQLLDEDDLVCQAGTGLAETVIGMRVPARHSLEGTVVRSQEPQLIEHDQRLTRDRGIARDLDVRCAITVPLFHRADPIGVLQVMARAPRAFEQSHVDLVQVMAGLVVSAVRQARRADENSRESLRDPLTGLVNRAFLNEALRLATAHCARDGGSVGLLCLDLDGFQPVNDKHGFAVGDEVLAEVGRRLRACVRAGDVVARVGGDEFVVLCENRDLVATSHLARRLDRSLTSPIETSAGPIALGVSIGAAVATGEDHPQQVLSRADAAMYRTKRSKQRGVDLRNISISGAGGGEPH